MGKQFSKASGQSVSADAAKQMIKQSGSKVQFKVNAYNNSTGVKIGDALGGGYRDMYKGMKASNSAGLGKVKDGLKAGFTTDGKINGARAAGGFVAASAAARVATGGGIYKDRYGNTNLIGVPFI